MTFTAPATDPTLTFTVDWVRSEFPPIHSLFDETAGSHGSVTHSTFELPAANRADAAFRCAVGLAARRLAANPTRFFAWLARASSAEPLDPTTAGLLRVPLLVNVGTPTEHAPMRHLTGLIAESLWFEIASVRPTAAGTPVLVEGHDWSVTDSGGDGLAIYRDGDSLSFALCESKSHSKAAAVRTTVNGACRQLVDNAPSYLGRFTTVAQRAAPDDDVAEYICLMSERWADKAPDAAVTVSVAAIDTCPHEKCFERMPRYFGLNDPQHSGHLFRIPKLSGFARRVRKVLWTGADL